MNERLEQKVNDYISDYLDGDDEGKAYVLHCAKHFYNLALEELRKEVKKRMSDAKEFSKRASGAKDDTVALTWGYTAESYKSLLNFMDKLSK